MPLNEICPFGWYAAYASASIFRYISSRFTDHRLKELAEIGMIFRCPPRRPDAEGGLHSPGLPVVSCEPSSHRRSVEARFSSSSNTRNFHSAALSSRDQPELSSEPLKCQLREAEREEPKKTEWVFSSLSDVAAVAAAAPNCRPTTRLT